MYGYLSKCCGAYTINDEDGNGIFVNENTIGQYTGFKDKNGKEIFEGDILDFRGIITEVQFVQGVFVFLVNGNLDEKLCGDCRTDLFAKIIGNIHENPDILKENERLNKTSNQTVGFIILILYTIAITVFKIMQ